MTGLLRADLLKLRRRKLFWIMLAVLAFFVGLSAFFLLAFPRIAPAELEGFPALEKPDAYIAGVNQVLGQTWFPVILAVVFFGAETSGTIWATALTRESRRWIHLLSKVVVLTLASWVATLLGVAGWAVVTALVAEGSGGPDTAAWLGVVWKSGISQLAWVSVALAATALVRSVGPAIGVGLALSLGESILSLWRPWQNVSLTGATYQLVGDAGELGALMGGAPGGGISLTHAVLVVAGWALVGLVLGMIGLQVRDP